MIHGLGQHGKSSLACRLASRFPSYDLVVVFNDYTPAGILRALRSSTALEGHAGAVEVQRILDEAGSGELTADAFTLVLARLLRGPLRELHTHGGRAEQRPILLVVDDFERALESMPGKLHRVRPELEAGVAALVTAFATTEHDSLLLITCRYRFTCVVNGKDADRRLAFYQLPDMAPGEMLRQTLQLARQRVAEQIKHNPGISPQEALDSEQQLFQELAGAIDDAFGSPSLMSRAARLRAESADAFQRFREAAQEFRTRGQTSEPRLREFLNIVAIHELLGLLTPDERELLRRSTLFEIPAPQAVLPLLHPRHHADAAAAVAAVQRQFDLGLLNRFENPLDFRRGHDHALVDPLVRPQLEQEGSSS